MEYDVFISYTPQDLRIARGICNYLEARGIRCFVSYRDVPTGSVLAGALVQALEKSKMMIVVLSDDYNNSPRVDREIEIAAEDNKVIVTFLMTYSKFEGAKRYYLNYRNSIDGVFNPDSKLKDLYDSVCLLLGIQNPPAMRNAISGKYNSGENRSKYDIASTLEFDPLSGTFKQKSLDSQNREVTFYQKAEANGIEGDAIYNNCFEFVDLGLPSGIKWATCNVGAMRPEDSGEYFAWGEINSKSSYSKDNSHTYGHGIEDMRQGNLINCYGNIIITRDVVCRRYGGSCRMPSKDDFEELINYTYHQWTTLNGIMGYRVISRTNGESIFLPACGRRSGFSLNYSGESGCYWSSTPSLEGSCSHTDAYCLDYFNGRFDLNHCNRYRGLCVRPIQAPY